LFGDVATMAALQVTAVPLFCNEFDGQMNSFLEFWTIKIYLAAV
jgi:hypothetical protein